MVLFSTLDELPPEAAGEVELRRQLGVKSSATFPLAVGGNEAVGAVTFNALREERTWPEKVVSQLRMVRELEDLIQQIPDVGATLSGADFTPDLRKGRSVRNIANRRLVLNNADVIEQKLRDNGFCATGKQSERLWRISVRASALSDIDYGGFVDTLREDVDPFVNEIDGVFDAFALDNARRLENQKIIR